MKFTSTLPDSKSNFDSLAFKKARELPAGHAASLEAGLHSSLLDATTFFV